MKHALYRSTVFLGLSLLCMGCPTNIGGAYVEILRAVQPDSSCNYTVGNQVSTIGQYDPTVNTSEGYVLALVLRNNLENAAADTVALGQIANVHTEINDTQILGLEACWYLTQDTTLGTGGNTNGFVDCNTIPNQSGWLPVLQTIGEGQDTQIVVVRALNLPQMRAIFGPTFTPELIPIEGAIPAYNYNSSDPNLQYVVSLAAESPADTTTRSSFWGAAYPLQRDVVVNLQVRAHLMSQSGTPIKSNWVSMPITICPGCLRNGCGMLQPLVCARGPCASGDACTYQGVCADGTLCSSTVLPSGTVPDFYVSGYCLPAQKFDIIPLTCQGVGCME